MNTQDFLKALDGCKMSLVHTAQVNVKVCSNVAHTHYTLYNEMGVCSKCGRCEAVKGIKVIFKKSERLTIFTALLLYDVFCDHKKPADYAQFHKSQAGQEFIANIYKVTPV